MRCTRNHIFLLIVIITVTSCDMFQGKQSNNEDELEIERGFDAKQIARQCVYCNESGEYIRPDSLMTELSGEQFKAVEEEIESLKTIIVGEAHNLAAMIDFRVTVYQVLDIYQKKQDYAHTLAPDYSRLYEESFRRVAENSGYRPYLVKILLTQYGCLGIMEVDGPNPNSITECQNNGELSDYLYEIILKQYELNNSSRVVFNIETVQFSSKEPLILLHNEVVNAVVRARQYLSDRIFNYADYWKLSDDKRSIVNEAIPLILEYPTARSVVKEETTRMLQFIPIDVEMWGAVMNDMVENTRSNITMDVEQFWDYLDVRCIREFFMITQLPVKPPVQQQKVDIEVFNEILDVVSNDAEIVTEMSFDDFGASL